MSVLARNGRLVTCGGTTGSMVQIALPHLFIKNQSVMGSTMGPRSAYPEILRLVRPRADKQTEVETCRHDVLVAIERRKTIGPVPAAPVAPGVTGI